MQFNELLIIKCLAKAKRNFFLQLTQYLETSNHLMMYSLPSSKTNRNAANFENDLHKLRICSCRLIEGQNTQRNFKSSKSSFTKDVADGRSLLTALS